MKAITFSIIISLIMIVISCCNQEVVSEVTFTQEDFPSTVFLNNPEIITFEQAPLISDPINYYFLKDTLVLVQNQVGANYALDLYSLDSGKHLISLAPKGRGPGEFVTLNLTVSASGLLYATDGKFYYTINQDSLVAHKLNFTHQFAYGAPGIHPMVGILPINDTSYIAYNLGYTSEAAFNPDNIQPLTKYIVGAESNVNQITFNPKYLAGPVNGGKLLATQNGAIWLADAHSPHIFIYNQDLELQKTLSGPVSYDIQYSKVETPAITLINFANEQCFRAYISGICTSKYVYLIFEGINGINSKDFESNKLPACEILKFTHDGELVCNYKLDKYIYTLTLSEDEKTFYCTARDSFAGAAYFIKYAI